MFQYQKPFEPHCQGRPCDLGTQPKRLKGIQCESRQHFAGWIQPSAIPANPVSCGHPALRSVHVGRSGFSPAPHLREEGVGALTLRHAITLFSSRERARSWCKRIKANDGGRTYFLRLKRSADAAGDFSAILAHCGLSPLSPIVVVAQLGLARVYAAQKDVAKSRAAYEGLFGEWKNADSDIPILKQAKAEYAKLQ